jgi:hypothetical protein
MSGSALGIRLAAAALALLAGIAACLVVAHLLTQVL